MDKLIIIPLNLFNFNQEIIIVDEQGPQTFAQVDFAHLPEVIVEASVVNNINNIRIIGNANYAEAISNEIKDYTVQNYANKNINIEIVEA